MKISDPKKILLVLTLTAFLSACGNEKSPPAENPLDNHHPSDSSNPASSSQEKPGQDKPNPDKPKPAVEKVENETDQEKGVPKKPCYPPRSPKLLVECRFVKENDHKKDKDKDKDKDRHWDGNKDKEKTKSSCVLSASICQNSGSGPLGDCEDHCKNTMVVACNGKPVYSDGAIHNRIDGHNYLIATSSPDLPIILHYPASHLKEADNVESWLTIGQYQLKGACDFSLIYDKDYECDHTGNNCKRQPHKPHHEQHHERD